MNNLWTIKILRHTPAGLESARLVRAEDMVLVVAAGRPARACTLELEVWRGEQRRSLVRETLVGSEFHGTYRLTMGQPLGRSCRLKVRVLVDGSEVCSMSVLQALPPLDNQGRLQIPAERQESEPTRLAFFKMLAGEIEKAA